MPPRPDPKSAKWRALRVASICAGIVSSQSCMEPIYFEGRPPGPATLSISVRSVDTLSARLVDGRFLVRTHLALEWNIPPIDFRAHPHLVDLKDLSGWQARRLPLPAPTGMLLDTFTCASGQINAWLLADLGSGYLLELSRQWTATEATRP